MSTVRKKEANSISPPYLFVLKEGPQHDKNFLDYSLCIMQVRPDKLKASENDRTLMYISERKSYDSHIGSPSPRAK